MTETTFTDPVLASVSLLFDGEAMRDLLARRLEPISDGEIVACRPGYVRYKPETSCLVAYDLVIRSNDQLTNHQAHVRVFADDRGQRRITSRKMRKLVDRASEVRETPPTGWTTYLPELNGLFSIFPVDYDLRSLVKVSAIHPAQKYVRRAIDQPELRLGQTPSLIRYKPGRKALLRYELEQTEHDAVYGKIHADDRSDTIRKATDSLRAAGVTTPPVLGTIPKLGFIVHAEAPGMPLASMRDDPRYVETIVALAEPLARLHRTTVDGLPEHRITDEIDRLHETASLLGVILPSQQQRLHGIVNTIIAGLSQVDDELATGHGDFYDDQAMVNGSEVALIDFDEIRLAHPLLDIGNMLAHLRVGETRGTVHAGSGAAFTDAIRQQRQINDHEVALFGAAGVLKLAPGPFRRLERGWPEAIDELLTVAETLLESLPSAFVGTTGVGTWDPELSLVRDENISELPALQNPLRMQTHLRAATDDPTLVLTGIDVQRHKPGRRAILRYDLANSEPIWGKIFASKRGPRVHAITRTICEAQAFGPDVSLPDPIAYIPELRLLLQHEVPGESIEPRLLAGETVLADRIAAAIHNLHASGIDLERQHDLAAELAPLHRRVTEVGDLFPALRDTAETLLGCLIDRAETIENWRFLPIHRDFYHEQVLATGTRLSVLDLDDAAMSEPAIDIANFAAHLDLLALQHPSHCKTISDVRDRFLTLSRALDPELDDHLLAFLTASTLVRLAGIHAPRAEGERIAAGLLDGAREALELPSTSQ